MHCEIRGKETKDFLRIVATRFYALPKLVVDGRKHMNFTKHIDKRWFLFERGSRQEISVKNEGLDELVSKGKRVPRLVNWLNSAMVGQYWIKGKLSKRLVLRQEQAMH